MKCIPGGVHNDEIEKITHRNALRLYRFDGLEKAGGREKCTVAALRELGADVDTREVSLEGIAPRRPRTRQGGDFGGRSRSTDGV